jgi:replicative DNA helicase
MQAINAETALLGVLARHPSVLDEVVDDIKPGDFYYPEHREIYRFMLDNTDFDQTIIFDHFVDSPQVLARVGRAISSGGSAGNIRAYIKRVIEDAQQREISQALVHLNDELPVDEKLAYLECLPAKLDRQKRGELTLAKDSLRDVVHQLENRHNGVAEDRIKTGYPDIDKQIGGLFKGDFIVIAGRPSMGKTTIAMNIAENVAVRQNIPCTVFSLEMPKSHLLNRSVCSLGKVDFSRFLDGKLNEDDWPRVTSAISMLNPAKLYLNDSNDWSIPKIRSAFRKAARAGAELIIFDYLQMLGGHSENRANYLAEVSRNFKAAAKELNIPIIALAQLNRSCEQRPNKRPMPSDLRECGQIEQDADVICLAYRDEVYNPETQHKGIAEFHFAKVRNGRQGTVRMVSRLDMCRFDSFTGNLPPLSDTSIKGKNYDKGCDI